MMNFNLRISDPEVPGFESVHSHFAIMNFGFHIAQFAFRDPHSNS
jgi:hypothetical protein